MLLSVVIPFYHVERYIGDCLAPAAQISDCELLLVDDCGSDASAQIAAEFCRTHEHARIIRREQNGGLSAARNTGFAQAQGEYIYEEQKVCGYNPSKNKKAERYPVPVKFWQCVDDPVVPYEVTERFIGRIKAAGGVAYLRPFPYGGHEPQDVGAPIENPCGIDVYKGEKIQINPAVEELFIWITNYN